MNAYKTLETNKYVGPKSNSIQGTGRLDAAPAKSTIGEFQWRTNDRLNVET